MAAKAPAGAEQVRAYMTPLVIFLILFVAVPVGELYLLLQVGSEIGALSTILLVVLTAAIGGYLVRVQGISVILRVREALARDQVPAIELLEGAMLLVAGFLLLLPGFVTDAVGGLLLIPLVRRRLILFWTKRARSVEVSVTGSAAESRGHRVIEGEFHRHDD